MPVFITQVWICEVCGKKVTADEEGLPSYNALSVPTQCQNWDWVGQRPDEKLACEVCVKKFVKGELNAPI